MTTGPAYRLGCPVWACDAWVGKLYATKDRRRWLGEYSSVFGTVEGNSTFYAMPEIDIVRRWADAAGLGFRFVLKTPGEITHRRQLVGAERETAEWLERLRVLQSADRLGPTMLQLPPYFSSANMPDLIRFLEAWPADLPLAVEPRHEDYFDGGPVENELDSLLRDRHIDRTLFDSRALFQAAPDDPIEAASQKRKPNPPRRLTVTGTRPVLRFVGRNQLAKTNKWVAEWAGVVADWIHGGLKPYVFCHSPDDTFAPDFCEAMHAAIGERSPGIAPLAEWPGRTAPKQRALF